MAEVGRPRASTPIDFDAMPDEIEDTDEGIVIGDYLLLERAYQQAWSGA